MVNRNIGLTSKSMIKLVLSALLLFYLPGCGSDEKGAKHNAAVGEKHTCPMHPQIIQDKPGICPICKMDLVPVRNNLGNDVSLMLSEQQIQLANIKTVRVGESDFQSSTILSGVLVSNPQATELIASRLTGRIERLFVAEAGRRVQKGEPLFEIFSEQLQVLQQDYLLQVNQAAAFPNERIYKTLRTAARNKLKLFGYPEASISALERRGKPLPRTTVHSTASGVVVEVLIAEGQYVSEGSAVLRLENYGSLWVEADVYPSELNQISVGSKLRVTVNGSTDYTNARVEFISPAINPSTQRLTIRASINNERGNLQAGMQARVHLLSGTRTAAISLPVEAVIRDESGAYVWVKSAENTFQERQVVTGVEDAQRVLIVSGLKDGEEVVSSGAYLLHSEKTLKKGTTL